MADIVDIAVGAGSFNTLVAAVQAAGLVDTLKSPGPFTVFAPNDDAFAQLPPGTIQTLLQNIPQLARILTFHVVSGKLMQADLAKVDSVISVEGSPIPINCTDGFEVKNATVLAPDIEADNICNQFINSFLCRSPRTHKPHATSTDKSVKLPVFSTKLINCMF